MWRAYPPLGPHSRRRAAGRLQCTLVLLAYLDGRISLAQLVDWAEGTFVDATLSPDEDIDLLNDILAYLAAADTAQFPLTWDVCTEFMDRLGVPIQVIASKRSV